MDSETEWTTITVPKHVKADLDVERGSKPWGAFLEELRKEHADPITLNDVSELADQLEAELEQSVDLQRLNGE